MAGTVLQQPLRVSPCFWGTDTRWPVLCSTWHACHHWLLASSACTAFPVLRLPSKTFSWSCLSKLNERIQHNRLKFWNVSRTSGQCVTWLFPRKWARVTKV